MLTSCQPPTVVGATAYGPPGKSQTQLADDGAHCNNPDNTVFAQCMLRLGDTVRLPNGRILTPSSAPPDTASAGAQSVDDYFGPAYAAEKAHNYAEAMQLFQKISNESSDPLSVAMADAHIGSFYEKGLGTTQNYRQAAYWYQKAADLHAGATGAELQLGILYAYGLGVPRNLAKAREIFYGMGGEGDLWLALLDTNKLPANPDEVTPQLFREALAERQRREEAAAAAEYKREMATAARQPTTSQSSSGSGTGKDPWGSALCNHILGTSAWNVFSPCNY